MEVFKSSTEYALSPIFGKDFVLRAFKVLKFAIKALSALGNEMFRLTSATRGGLLLMMVFFYSAFVLGTTIWIETGYNEENCTSFQQCSYTLMRLTFYDGTGFDFAYTLTSKHRFLFFLAIVYMCLTSFGILNGLVGIFGTAFAAASDDAFRDEDDDNDDDGGDNNGDEGDDGSPDVGIHKLSSFKRYKDRQNNGDGGGNNNNDDEQEDGGEDSQEKVALYGADDSDENGDFAMPVQKAPSMSKMEVKALQNKLKGALGGKSAFALKELTKMAAAVEVQKVAVPKRTFRDIVASKGIVGAAGGAAKPSGVHPMFAAAVAASAAKSGGDDNAGANAQTSNNNSTDTPPQMESPDKEKLKKHLGMFGAKKDKPNKHVHAAAGMFANLKGKSSKNLAPHNSSSAGNGASGGGAGVFKEYMQHQAMVSAGVAAADVKSINASIHTLQSTVEKQNEMIVNLFKQIQVMNQQLHAIYPEIEIKPVPDPVPQAPAESEPAPAAAMPRKFTMLKLGMAKAATEMANEVVAEISDIAHHVHVPGSAAGDNSHDKDKSHAAAAADSAAPAEHHPMKDAFHGAMNFMKSHGHASAAPSSAVSPVTVPAEPSPVAATSHAATSAAAPTPAPAVKGAASMFRAIKQPAAAHPQVSAQPATTKPDTTSTAAPVLQPAAPSLAAVHPQPEPEPQTTHSPVPHESGPAPSTSMAMVHPSPDIHPAPATVQPVTPAAGAVNTTFPSESSLGSVGSIELIEPREDRMPSRSKPRKSPMGHRHGSSHSQHNANSQGSILGAMGKIKPKTDPLADGMESDDAVHSFSMQGSMGNRGSPGTSYEWNNASPMVHPGLPESPGSLPAPSEKSDQDVHQLGSDQSLSVLEL